MNLDNEIILLTYELSDMIQESEEVMEYIIIKKQMDEDKEVLNLKKELNKLRQDHEEVNRFGSYHPDFNHLNKKVDDVLAEINKNELVKRYKKAESNLNNLFYEISNSLAKSISNSIMVPKEDNLLDDPFCTTGNCNTCGLKGSCSI